MLRTREPDRLPYLSIGIALVNGQHDVIIGARTVIVSAQKAAWLQEFFAVLAIAQHGRECVIAVNEGNIAGRRTDELIDFARRVCTRRDQQFSSQPIKSMEER